MSDSEAAAISGLFKMVSDPFRVRVLNVISVKSPITVGALCTILDVNQPALSHHLSLLRVSGLAEYRRDGTHNFYSLTHLGKYLVSTFTELHKRAS